MATLRAEGCRQNFGPLWTDPVHVLHCLRRYARDEGHNFSGMTVAQVAAWHFINPYECAGEECDALVCLLQLGQGETKI